MFKNCVYLTDKVSLNLLSFAVDHSCPFSQNQLNPVYFIHITKGPASSIVAAYSFVVYRNTVLLQRTCCLQRSAVPVSYTHLDVYKRQVLYSNVLDTCRRIGYVLNMKNCIL